MWQRAKHGRRAARNDNNKTVVLVCNGNERNVMKMKAYWLKVRANDVAVLIVKKKRWCADGGSGWCEVSMTTNRMTVTKTKIGRTTNDAAKERLERR